MDLDLVKSEILRDVFRDGMTAPTRASERPLPSGQAPITWPAQVLKEAKEAEVLTTVKTSLPKFFNPLFRKQNLVNRSLIASMRAGADGLAGVMHTADRLTNEMEVLRRLVVASGVSPDAKGLPQVRRAARIGEPIVTLPWVLKQIGRLPAGATVLLAGCMDNLLNLELASLGFKVIGVDERECGDDHPNFKFIEANPAAPPLAPASVDAVIAVSGLGRATPGAMTVQAPDEADRAAMLAWRRILKPGGAVLLAIPFGKTSSTDIRQLYDSPTLDALLKGWTVEVREFAVCSPLQSWLYPTPEPEAGRTTVDKAGRSQAVALVLARK